jgi:glycosyltransferase involved in cell wall biosynthesis
MEWLITAYSRENHEPGIHFRRCEGVCRNMRFHLLGLVHLPVSRTFMGCAFTQKILKLSRMLLSLGHEVVLYGSEGSDAPCTEFVQTHTLREIRQTWGSGDNRAECDGLGYDWRKENFRHDFNTAKTPLTLRTYNAMATEINKRKRPDDFLLIMQGVYQKRVSDAVRLWLTCEPGIGYRGSFARFRAFESAYLMNFTYGSEKPKQSVNGHYYDRVVPNYFEPEDFPFCEEKDDYFLFIGRMIERKGVWTAVKTTQAIGARLVLAGQESDEIKVSDLPNHCEFVGYVDPEQRAELMGKAKAVFVPTVYLEAFGGVNVEAQLCGTPVLTTSFGVFPETVRDGETGFLCNTLDDFVHGARCVGELDPCVIRAHAERYTLDSVRWDFQRWFEDLYNLYESAQDNTPTGWHRVREHVPEWREHVLR